MILHVVRDEKFTDIGLENFEAAVPGLNVAIAIGARPDRHRYVRRTSIRYVSRTDVWSADFRRLLRDADAIVFHSLAGPSLDVLRHAAFLGFSGKIAWVGWGFDYYDLLDFEQFEPDTRESFRDRIGAVDDGGWLPAIRRAAARALHLDKRRLLRRIDYFAPVVFEDYAMVTNAVPELTASYVRWNYGSASVETVTALPSGWLGGILLGNSAHPTNNHLEALRTLADVGVQERRVITPLNYGSDWYRDAIIAAGSRMLGDAFQPLTEFLPSDEYLDIVAHCSHAVMNHRRQQALGNITAMLARGARLLLNDASPLYRFFTTAGFHLDRIGALASHPEMLREPLDPMRIAENRRLLSEHFGAERIRRNTVDLVAALAAR